MAHAHANKDRSDASHAILDTESRKKKGHKIAFLLNYETNLEKAKLLDIGTGSGHIAEELSKHAKLVTSIDITDERRVKKGYEFIKVNDENMPFKDNEFDVVVSNHVIEHTPNQDLHISEAMRVLKPGGILYLATPNKLWVSDPHYKLPIISWLPRPVANLYIRAAKRGSEWDIYPTSLQGIRRRAKDFRVKNMLPFLIRADNSNLDVATGQTKMLSKLPESLDFLSEYYSPTIICVVKK